MRRICCFCERWASGGIESFLCNVLSRMDLERFQVDIVSARKEESVFTRVLEDCGIHFYELSGSLRKVWENHRLFKSLLEERAYDVLHLNAFHALSLSYLHIAKKSGVPVRVAHSHNTSLRKSLTKVAKMGVHSWAKEKYTQYATDLWACSRQAAEFLFADQVLKQKGFKFIPNGIDTRRFKFNVNIRNKLREELNLEGKFVVGNIGRLCSQKNQTFLLDVFYELLKEKPESRLVLVGDGEERNYLKKKTIILGITDKVLFYGLTDYPEHLLWAMDVFVMTSLFEGFPVAGVEAQAAGLPCIFSDAIAPECNITDNVTPVALSDSPQKWAQEIIHAKKNENRLSSADIVGNMGFDIEILAKRIESIYSGDFQHISSVACKMNL